MFVFFDSSKIHFHNVGAQKVLGEDYMKLHDTHSNNEKNLVKTTLTEPLWTVEDVANFLRLKQETVRMMARANKIPALKIGKVWRFRVGDVKDMLKLRTK